MPAPLDRATRIIAMFDSYFKTVARNVNRNLKRNKEDRAEYKTTITAPMQYIFDLLSHEDTRPSDNYVLYADKFSCAVYSQSLYNSLLSLPDQ